VPIGNVADLSIRKDVRVSLINELVGEDLSSVVFVADYVQFDFNGPRLTVFVWPTAQTFGEKRTIGDPGYRDALCGLITRSVTATLDTAEDGVVLKFDNDALTIKPSAADLGGPEIAMLQMNDASKRWEVWRPGEGAFEHGDW
jgi:hypothetical protein